MKDNKGYNALHFAVLQNRKAIVKALLETPNSSEFVNGVDMKGYSPIRFGFKLGLATRYCTSSIQVILEIHMAITASTLRHIAVI